MHGATIKISNNVISVSYDSEYPRYITLECDVMQSGEQPHTSPKNLLRLSSEQDIICINLLHTAVGRVAQSV
jgi:hypothetical protein